MTIKIGKILLSGRVTLAPMAGVTDAAFRRLCRAQGAALTCTEMVSARALVYKDKKTEALLWCPEEDHPVAAQIFGHEPEIMAEAAPMALELSGADILDINMGCPVGKVIRGGDGSALMRDPELAGRIIEAVAKAVDAPVTVKFRKGWDGGSVNAVEFAQICEQAGASAIAVHGRTRVQMYAGRADWDIIRDVKEVAEQHGVGLAEPDGRRLSRDEGGGLYGVGIGIAPAGSILLCAALIAVVYAHHSRGRVDTHLVGRSEFDKGRHIIIVVEICQPAAECACGSVVIEYRHRSAGSGLAVGEVEHIARGEG